MSAFDVFKEPIALVKKDGNKTNHQAIFSQGNRDSPSRFTIEDTELVIDAGDVVIRKLPKNEERYVVEEVQFQRGLRTIKAAQVMLVKREGSSPVHSNINGGISNRIFIVHGHDVQFKSEIARLLERLGLQPIILHERGNQGRTIIEKFEEESDVGFAVILLTPDDIGGTSETNLRPRARQNVVLELGYFMGKLGRRRVCAMKRGEIEFPSDFHGIVWVALDNSGAWKTSLLQELKAAGYQVDANMLLA